MWVVSSGGANGAPVPSGPVATEQQPWQPREDEPGTMENIPPGAANILANCFLACFVMVVYYSPRICWHRHAGYLRSICLQRQSRGHRRKRVGLLLKAGLTVLTGKQQTRHAQASQQRCWADQFDRPHQRGVDSSFRQWRPCASQSPTHPTYV